MIGDLRLLLSWIAHSDRVGIPLMRLVGNRSVRPTVNSGRPGKHRVAGVIE